MALAETLSAHKSKIIGAVVVFAGAVVGHVVKKFLPAFGGILSNVVYALVGFGLVMWGITDRSMAKDFAMGVGVDWLVEFAVPLIPGVA